MKMKNMTKSGKLIITILLFTISVNSEVLETPLFLIDYELTGEHAIAVDIDSDNNGHPDYVDSIASYAAEAWTIITDTLNFPPPLPHDTTSSKYVIKVRDVYTIDNTLDQALGNCMRSANGCSEVFVENDFIYGSNRDSAYASQKSDGLWRSINSVTNPFPYLKMVVFHELFHATQVFYLKLSFTPLTETAAVWFQNRWASDSTMGYGSIFIKNLEMGWFDSASQYFNFPYLWYAEEKLGRGFIKAYHEYRGSTIPDKPGNLQQESRNFHNFCQNNDYSEDDLVKGMANEIVSILNGSEPRILTSLGDFQKRSNVKPSINRLDLNENPEITHSGKPYGMDIFTIMIGGYPTDSYIKIDVTQIDAWGYIVPVFKTDDGSVIIGSVYYDNSNSFQIQFLENASSLELYCQHGWAGMSCDIQLILPDNTPSKTKPLTVFSSGSLDAEHNESAAFDQNLETGWVASTISDTKSIGLDLGEECQINSVVLYWTYKIDSGSMFATPFELQYSIDGEMFTMFHENMGLGGTEVIPVNLSARYLKLLFTGTMASLSQELLEFEVLVDKPTIKIADNIVVNKINKVPVSTRGNRLVILENSNQENVYKLFSLDGRIAAEFKTSSRMQFISEPLTSGTYIVRSLRNASSKSFRVIIP